MNGRLRLRTGSAVSSVDSVLTVTLCFFSDDDDDVCLFVCFFCEELPFFCRLGVNATAQFNNLSSSPCLRPRDLLSSCLESTVSFEEVLTAVLEVVAPALCVVEEVEEVEEEDD